MSFFLAGRHLWVVGDDDQTLYAFRAADVRYTLEFSKKYCGARVHVLDRNYRSAARIVAAAKQLIANNRRRQAKDYQPFIGDLGEIVIRGYSSPEIEARQTARAVLKLLEQLSPRQIAILYRVGSVGLAVQPALQQLQIPYEVRGAGDLWQSVAAKLVVGSRYYLREGDSVEALSRMGNSRRADIIRRKLDLAEKDQKHSFAALCRLVRNAVVTALPSKASDRDRAEWRTVVETVVTVALSCASLEELEKRISEHSAALRNPPENAVALSTIHSAKGQEWEAVIMVGMEDGVLPHANNDDIEEERRVAYVGITRAKRILGLTYANVRYGQAASPSPFLHEIASKKRSACVWTGPRADTADERLPLLSERERHRVNENLQCIAIDSAGSSADAERTALSVASQDQSKGKKADGLPSRHGRSWSAQEDDRLRTMFLRGDGLAMIASAHQRKRGAIRSRLLKLGLIAENASPHSDCRQLAKRAGWCLLGRRFASPR